MKKLIYNLVAVALLATSFSSCESFLEKAPDDRMSVQTLDDVSAVMAETYDKMSTHSGLFFATDNVTLADGVTQSYPILTDLYSWKKIITNEKHQDNPASFWENSYSSIANCNLVLESLRNMNGETRNSDFAKALQAEALIGRAYYHFMILNTFSKRYETATAATDLGIPYTKKLENKLIEKYDRSTVEACYNEIITDYEQGIKLLEANSNSFNTNKYRITIPTAYAIGGRIYLWRNKDQSDNEKSKAYSTKAIAAYGGVVSMKKWSDYALDKRAIIEVKSPEVGWVQTYYTWQLGSYIYQSTNSSYKNITQPSVLGKDLRDNGSGYKLQGDIFLPLNYFIQVGYSGKLSNDLFPLSESVINLVEAKVRLNDLKGAYDDMQNFLVTNHEAPIAFTDKDLIDTFSDVDGKPLTAQEAWIQFILNQRKRQYYYKGLRWYDIHRYQINIEHRLKDGRLLKLNEELPLFAFEIPQFAIINGLKQNY
ncbi:RagB/SusD family nutrient uptake outer membrane protein [Halosquirtibacter xylanolyticus]|uniref:RagB/SusD family nutrient uptake outer membrane protein n=1 Tax=Halosquirtibacter xylanolyticus TaxID=3374599 RepID=UPI0037480853|nr:RagB/SusD family nutrient uptake outer membrane protein [Prolixibacteraceae bacterium]